MSRSDIQQRQQDYLCYYSSFVRFFTTTDFIFLRQQRQQEQREERAQLRMSRGDIQHRQLRLPFLLRLSSLSVLSFKNKTKPPLDGFRRQQRQQ